MDMQISNRIQKLRKEKGLSQDQLAGEIGVSRQAVSKWESQQSLPDVEKLIALSDYFGVSTDYLLKGTENNIGSPYKNEKQNKKSDYLFPIIGKILYMASAFFIALELISAFANWYEHQRMTDLIGSFLLGAAGVFSYMAGRIFSKDRPSFVLKCLNALMLLFIPLSLLLTALLHGLPSPYPLDPITGIVFLLIYILLSIFICRFFKKKSK